MEWKFKDGIPIYQQIIQIVELLICRGDYPPGGKLPSVRELALEAGVNPNTMQRALAELEREGILRSKSTSGRFVTDEEGVLKKLKEDLARGMIREFFESLQGLGLSPDEILEVTRAYREEHFPAEKKEV